MKKLSKLMCLLLAVGMLMGIAPVAVMLERGAEAPPAVRKPCASAAGP